MRKITFYLAMIALVLGSCSSEDDSIIIDDSASKEVTDEIVISSLPEEVETRLNIAHDLFSNLIDESEGAKKNTEIDKNTAGSYSYYTHSWKTDRGYLSGTKAVKSGTRKSNFHTTQFAVFNVLLEGDRQQAEKDLLKVSMLGTGQKVYIEFTPNQIDFGPSRGNLYKIKPFGFSNKSFTAYHTDDIQIEVHSNIYGYTALVIRVNDQVKYSEVTRFNYSSSYNNRTGITLNADGTGPTYFFGDFGWFKEN